MRVRRRFKQTGAFPIALNIARIREASSGVRRRQLHGYKKIIDRADRLQGVCFEKMSFGWQLPMPEAPGDKPHGRFGIGC
jgi:hypothetical protein